MPEYIDEGFPISAGRHLAIRYVAALGGAWVVMPNQVHMLPKVQTSMLMRWTKGTPARRANQITRRTGLPFPQDESYGHWVRTVANGIGSSEIEANPDRLDCAEEWRMGLGPARVGIQITGRRIAGRIGCPTKYPISTSVT